MYSIIIYIFLKNQQKTSDQLKKHFWKVQEENKMQPLQQKKKLF